MKWLFKELDSAEWAMSGDSYWIEQDDKNKNYQYIHLEINGIEVGSIRIVRSKIKQLYDWKSYRGSNYKVEWR